MPVTRFGIIGCGGAAVSVGEAIAASPLTDLACVYDLDTGLARDLSERCRVPYADALETMLADPGLEAVYIAVPHDQLAPLATLALEAGKNVLVEKPMAITLAEADALIALSDERQLALGVFYEYRQAAPHVQARELIRTGALGRIIGVHIETLIDKPLAYWQHGHAGRSVSSWRGQKARAGGGVLLMNTSHQLDFIWYVTRLEVASVSAQIGALVAGVEVEDTAAVTLLYDTGAIGSLYAGAHVPGASPGGERAFIYGTNGQLRLPDPYGPGSVQVFVNEAWGTLTPGVWHTVDCPATPVFLNAVEAFARAVQAGETAPTSGRDGRRVLEIILAIYQAAAEGRTIGVPSRPAIENAENLSSRIHK